MIDIILDTSLDCLKMLPFLFVAFLVIEGLEHYSTDFTAKILAKVGAAGPVVGAVTGCVPQCGFSVMAANLYSGGVISVGTLIAVFIATSDEAVLIMLGNPEHIGEIGMLLAVKVIIAVAAGYLVDIFLGNKITETRSSVDFCRDCGCHEEAGIVKPAWRHTTKIFVYLFVFTGILNLCIEILGVERLSVILLGDTIFQPLAAAVVGLIPNCAASVILTQLYLNGAISFASVISGLCTGAGIGLVVLCRMNKNKRENLKIIGMLVLISVSAGMFLQVVC